ncbi:hypothetical protein SETIT_9G335400v2 [Setaria italica]|uniref:DUF1618 domain-containing protein n=2 Tax=Setaria TaxID=4554 RepID=A0A368SNK6_SETIT|nr:uncharacterized protein LOC111258468 [Setaria italica]XP_034570852.1 uncharacterized protein LOC117835611 [Setaria viridis]RCV43953.1 hypothetical protein SETIT_9G335400v2 [Setaria italica]TKV95102.1 hypothetical protein SEVIR_9G338600v2 [Setaria viridis]
MAQPSWIILPRVLRVNRLPDGADLRLTLAPPPSLARLTVSTRVSPANPNPHRVLAADLSAGLLLTVAAPTPTPPHLPPANPEYFVLDVISGTAHRLPGTGVLSSASPGVISAPNGGFMVVGFQYLVDSPAARLHCFSSQTGNWVTRDVNNPLPSRTWAFDDVIPHDGKLWWVDTAATAGLLSCDPFADNPNMAFVRLPDHVDDEAADAYGFDSDDSDQSDRRHGFCSYCSAEIPLAFRRRVQLVDGTFRWVQMACGHMDEAREGAPTLTVLTLLDPEADFGWSLEPDLSFADIWSSDTYKAAGLPEYEEPVVALIHPNNPNVLYFFLDGYLFGVDRLAKEVLGRAPHGMASISSPSLLAWELPPALIAAAAAAGGEV